MDMKLLEERLRAFDAIRDADQVARGTLDRIQPQVAKGWPSEVHPAIRRTLENIGLPQPFRHQFDAVQASLSGRDVILESPTASGKTLGFLVPMFDLLMREPDSHGLLIYPTKALAFDQRSKIQDFCDQLAGGRRIESWPYDGDSDQDMRNAIRKRPPTLLMTNPEYLNMSFLAYKDQWTQFLARLRFVVLDEVHESGLADGTALFYGTLDIYTGFNGYRIVDEQSGEVKERVQASDGRSLRKLHGFWIQFASDGDAERQGIGGFEHILRVGTSFVIPVDRFDTGTHAEAGSACVAYYFENYPGGIGVARKLWSEWQKALTEGIKIAENCRCSKGCLNCIEPPKSFISANIDKHAGIALARRALATANG